MEQIALLSLLHLSVDIAGSGNPLYVAELCKWHSYGQTRSFGLVLFAKKACYIQKDGPEAKIRRKNWQKPSKKGVFSSPSYQLDEFG